MNATIKRLPGGDFEVAAAASIFDWHTWGGGEMPLPPDVLIDVEYRNGEVRAARAGQEGAGWWLHDNDAHDIVRYRLREPGPVTFAGPEPTDNVNHPAHYTQGGIECIDAIQAALTPDEFRGYLKGNALKYIWRERHKGGEESIRKAEWYIARMVRSGR